MSNEPTEGDFHRRDFLRFGAALGLGAIFAPDAAEAALPAAGPDITHGLRSRKEVALTFHGAGSTAYAKAILAEVAKANAGISVLVVGTWLKEFPEMAKLILDGGHDLGNHTMTHPVLTQLSLKKVEAQINECDAILKKITGHKGAWFRPSGTLKSNATIRTAAGRAGYKNCITYDVDSLDYTDQSTSATVKTVERLVKPGSIIGMHFGHQHTIKAIPLILADLHAKGLKPVTLTQLLRK
ncbi:peptidoglycan-N-acetylglucosamine deacetylase [mine drainage metagenome]|uniref:Peptidoglycan-N-acetylglucosamine deacetylase n=1 Tax=mine drainage metagenome TaxID=410659 RepID=A0A1J5QCL5_9ZZZZ